VISFRFHLVSLVAVFMALGLGVLAGTTVINQGIVADLDRRLDDFEQVNEQLRGDVADLQTEVDAWTAARPYLVHDQLLGERAIVVTEQWTDETTATSVLDGLRRAGAEVMALLSVGDRMALATEGDRQALAGALGAPGVNAADALRVQAATDLADRLAFGPVGGDVLVDLIDQDFLLNQGAQLGEEGLQELVAADLVVVVAGNGDRPVVQPGSFLVPLIEALTDADNQAVGAAEGWSSAYDFVGLLRNDGAVSDRIVTQDNVDQVPGQIGFVIGLKDLVRFGVSGHYGIKDGASRALPPPTEG
jgi:hypothetical protein